MRELTLLFILTFLLSSCASPTPPPAPTATAAPTSTPTPTATPTPTPVPTITPTPIPTLPPQQTGGLTGIPDPRATKPELLDLRNPNAPIPQFVNAVNMASTGCSERFWGRIRL